MSIQAINWAIETRVGDPVLKVLLMTLGNYANIENQLWHRQELIAHDTEISVRTLRRRLGELVKLGLIQIDERRREDGGKTSSMITLLRSPATASVHPPPAKMAGTPPDTAVTGGPDTTVAGQESKSNRKKKDDSYSDEFEDLWKAYPRTRNTSKKKAWDHYRMLNEENQARVRAAVPVFAAAMRAEGRPEDKIKHLQFFLSERIWETVGGPAKPAGASGGAPGVPWHKTATRDQWERLLKIWRGDMNWRLAWGPAPGRPGCGVPDDMLTDEEKGTRSQNREPRNAGDAAA